MVNLFRSLKSTVSSGYKSIFGNISMIDEATKELSKKQNVMLDKLDPSTLMV